MFPKPKALLRMSLNISYISVKVLFVFPVQLDYFIGMVKTENTGWEGIAWLNCLSFCWEIPCQPWVTCSGNNLCIILQLSLACENLKTITCNFNIYRLEITWPHKHQWYSNITTQYNTKLWRIRISVPTGVHDIGLYSFHFISCKAQPGTCHHIRLHK